jgi:hypothetical protein
VVDLTDDSPEPTPAQEPPVEEAGRSCTLGCGQWIPRDEWQDHQLAHAQVTMLHPPHVRWLIERDIESFASRPVERLRFPSAARASPREV